MLIIILLLLHFKFNKFYVQYVQPSGVSGVECMHR